MAIVNKNFRIKNGLIVEGTTGTINGDNILVENGGDEYILNLVGGATLVKSVDTGTFTVDGSGNLTINSGVFDPAGAADTAQSNAESYTDSQIGTLDTGNTVAMQISQAQSAAENYADGLASNYDAAGSASTAEQNAKNYADGLASNYDPAGAANTAENNANSYTDSALGSYTPTSSLDTTIDGYGYLKSADLSGYATESYVGTAITNLVDGAPDLLNTLNELAAAIDNDASYASTLTTALGNKQNTLTAGTGIDIVSDTISVTANTYDAYGAAGTAESNANSYTDTAIGNLNTDSIPEGSINLYFTGDRVLGAIQTATEIAPAAVSINNYRKEEATQQYVSAASTVNVHTFSYPYESVKYLVRVVGWNGGVKHSQLTEILITVDGNNNIAITEYGTICTDANNLASFSASYASGAFNLTATTAVAGCEIIAAATMLSWAD